MDSGKSDAAELTADERLWATLAHLCGLLWASGIPFGGTIGAAIVYVTKRHVSPFVADATREAQNFQNTVAIAVLAVVATVAIFAFFSAQADGSIALGCIALGCLALAAILIANGILSIVAAIAVHRGNAYRYPLCLRLIGSGERDASSGPH